MSMKFDIRKLWQYKYLSYKLKKECLKNKTLQDLNEDEKEKICIEATKKTREITWIVIIIYIPVMCFFIFGFVGNYKYIDNVFVKWFKGIYESVFSFFTGEIDWGSAWYEKRGTVLTIFLKLLPAFIIQASPLFIAIIIIANRNLKKEINFILKKQ